MWIMHGIIASNVLTIPWKQDWKENIESLYILDQFPTLIKKSRDDLYTWTSVDKTGRLLYTAYRIFRLAVQCSFTYASNLNFLYSKCHIVGQMFNICGYRCTCEPGLKLQRTTILKIPVTALCTGVSLLSSWCQCFKCALAHVLVAFTGVWCMCAGQ